MPTTRSRRPRKSPREREEEITQLKATLDAAVARLAADPDQWIEFLDVVATFAARYSFGNQLAILVQAAARGFTPTMVRPYGTRDRATGKPRAGWAGGWLALGRNVKKGEKALRIWRPVRKRYTEAEAAALAAAGKPVRRDAHGRLPQRLVGFALASVFDLSQTDGEPVEVDTVTVRRRVRAPGGVRARLLAGDDSTGALAEVIALIAEQGYAFERAERLSLGGANGDTDSRTRVVRVREDVEPAQAVKTAVHELAHILCGHVEPGYGYHAHRGRAETEAESVAYIVCGALGLDTGAYSAPYVAGWCEGDMSTVSEAGTRVVAVARRILTALDPEDAEDAEDDTDQSSGEGGESPRVAA